MQKLTRLQARVADGREEQLVRQAKDGDTEAFGDLYGIYIDAIYRYIYFRVGHEREAEDLTEEVFVKAWEALPTYRITQHPFKSWLYRIAHNLVVDYHRKRRPVTLAEPELNANLQPSPNAEETVERWQRTDRLTKAIQRLKEEEQQVIILRFLEELSHQEVAKVIGKSEAASRIIQHRALAKLAKLLK